MLSYKRTAVKKIVVAICLVTAVSLAMLMNPIAIYAEHTNTAPVHPLSAVPEPTSVLTPEAGLAEIEPDEPEVSYEIIPTPEDAPAKLALQWPIDGGYILVGVNGYKGHTGMDIAAPSNT
ncbi:MAG: hypothetical protein RSF82_13135, partial [Angelakisella sp.]